MKTIGIVDDAACSLKCLKVQLEQIEIDEIINVQTYRNPLKALESLSLIKPDLIISDYMMFDMDGLSLITNLKKNNVTCPFILYTSLDKHDIPELAEQDDVIYIKKPYPLESLKSLVTPLLK